MIMPWDPLLQPAMNTVLSSNAEIQITPSDNVVTSSASIRGTVREFLREIDAPPLPLDVFYKTTIYGSANAVMPSASDNQQECMQRLDAYSERVSKAIKDIETGSEGQRNVKFQQTRQFLEPAGYFSGGLLAAGYDPHEKITVTFNSYVGIGHPQTLSDTSTRTYFAWEIAAGTLVHDRVQRGGTVNFQSMVIEQKDRNKVKDLESAGKNLQNHWENEIAKPMRDVEGVLAKRSGVADAYVLKGTLQSLLKTQGHNMVYEERTAIERALNGNGQVIIPNLYGYPLAGFAFIPITPYDGNPENRPNKGVMIDLKNGTVSSIWSDQDFANWAPDNREQLLRSFNARDRQGGIDAHWPKASELLDDYIAGNVRTFPGYRSLVKDKPVPIWETFNYTESRDSDYQLKYGPVNAIAKQYQEVNAKNAVWDDQTKVFGHSQQNWKEAKELWSNTFGYVPVVGNAGNLVFGIHDALHGMTANDRVGGGAAAVIAGLQLVHELAPFAAEGGLSEVDSALSTHYKWSDESFEHDFELVRTPQASVVPDQVPPVSFPGMREVAFRGQKYFAAETPDAGDGAHYVLRQRDPQDSSKLVNTGKIAKPDADGVWRARGVAGGSNEPVPLKERIAGTTLERPATREQILALDRKPGSGYYATSLDPNEPRPFKPDGAYAFVIRVEEPDKVYIGSMNKGLTPEGKRYPFTLRTNPDWVGGHSALTHGLKTLKGGTTDVLFAGEVYIKNGAIEFWTNGSGHYQPPTELRETNITPAVKNILPDDKYVERDQLTRVQENMWNSSTHLTPKELAQHDEWVKEEFNIGDTDSDNEISDDD